MEIFEIDYLVVGGGAAGMATATRLSSLGKHVILIERNNLLAQETTSRNSEVIHAGIYYKEGSLKSELCIRGKNLLYEYLDLHDISYNKCGKYILATSALEEKKLIDIYNNGMECGVTDLVIDHDDINDYEFLNFRTSVFSPSTGVFDSHHFIHSLKNEFEDNDGLLLVGNELKSIDYVKDSFEVLINDLNNKTEFVIRTKRIVNSAGLNTYKIINELKGTDQYIPKYMKGEYYSYGGKQKLNHLIYPIPGEYSLGIHATIDLGHGIRFGPSSYEVTDLDYQVSFDHRESFFESIKGYWTDINIEELEPSYSGIRPLLNDIDDFLIDQINFDDSSMISILGYASPGLTSSLALAEKVADQIIEF